ncbi:acyltransferase [Globicatella sanguinis]
MRKYYFYFMEKIAKIIKRDSMSYRLKRYKLYGANIGNNVRTFSPISGSESYLISIGNNVTISTGVKFITHDNSIIKFRENATDLVGEIKIGDNCFIGANALILPGVSIGKNCIISAGAVVSSSFLDGVIIGGNPAKIIGDVNSYINKHNSDYFNFKGMSYIERKEEILRHPEKLIKRKVQSKID